MGSGVGAASDPVSDSGTLLSSASVVVSVSSAGTFSSVASTDSVAVEFPSAAML